MIFQAEDSSIEPTNEFDFTKGQLISKCPYEKTVSSKIPTKIYLDFFPEFFHSFLGASWKLFGLPVGFPIYDITY